MHGVREGRQRDDAEDGYIVKMAWRTPWRLTVCGLCRVASVCGCGLCMFYYYLYCCIHSS